MNELALKFEVYDVRMVMIDGEPWWILADICSVLEIDNPTQVAQRLDEDEKSTLCNIEGANGGPARNIISEPGLYKLLQTSRKPQAKRFDRWVRHEVLPEIRKTGSYNGGLPTLANIGNLFEEKLIPVHRELTNNRLKIESVENNVTFLARRVDDIVPRRDFPKEAKKQFRCVVVQKYDGDCPCCREVKLDETDSHCDHFVGRELNGPEHGWIVCRKCNFRLHSDNEFKISRRPHFEVFQDYRRKMFAGRTIHRKGSRTIKNKDQADLFEGKKP